jgi:hypothetical protein
LTTDYIKRAISMLLVVLCFSACAGTRKDWMITGGSQANGIVELSYQYREFEVPHTNEAQAHVVANLGCHEWGYSNSRPFGRPIKNCNQHGGFLEDCASWTVSRQYWCRVPLMKHGFQLGLASEDLQRPQVLTFRASRRKRISADDRNHQQCIRIRLSRSRTRGLG